MRAVNDDDDTTAARIQVTPVLHDTVRWVGDAATGFLRLIDQTRLPTEFVEIDCRDVPAVWEAIKSLRVRGAPAIGVAAAYGAVIGARSQGADDAAAVRARARARPPLPPHQPADGRQPVLGARSDGRRRWAANRG